MIEGRTARGRTYMRVPLIERLWARVVPAASGCWEWTGGRSNKGYGLIMPAGNGNVPVLTHRLSYESAFGPIPKGMELDHTCQNKVCVRPVHMDVLTKSQHSVRSVARRDAINPNWRRPCR